jgi:hypothetical protein
LHRMQSAIIRQILDADDFGTVRLAGEDDAGINGGIVDAIAGAAAQHHRAGPAIALGAPLLGAGGTLIEAEIVKQRKARRGVAQANNGAPAQELNMTTHRYFSTLSSLAEPHPSLNDPPIPAPAEGSKTGSLCPLIRRSPAICKARSHHKAPTTKV